MGNKNRRVGIYICAQFDFCMLPEKTEKVKKSSYGTETQHYVPPRGRGDRGHPEVCSTLHDIQFIKTQLIATD